MPDSPDRRFTEKETTAIIARAARAQLAAETVPEAGLSLAELQDVGRAAGLSPDHIAAAAAALAEEETGSASTTFGMAAEIRHTRILPTPVSDGEWEQMVAWLRQQYGHGGVGGQVGRLREWTGGTTSGSGAHEVHVVLAPHNYGAKLTLEERGANKEGKDFLVAGGVMAGMGVLLSVIPVFGTAPAAILWLCGLFVMFGVLLGGWGVIGTRAWARRRSAMFEATLDRLELIARVDAPTATSGRLEG